MKKIFIYPECDVILLAKEDVITTSYNGNEIDVNEKNDELDLPGVGF